MKLFNKLSVSVMALLLGAATLPGAAQAADHVYIDSPIISVGFNSRGSSKFRSNRSYNRSYNRGSNRSFNRGFNNRRFNNNRFNSNRRFYNNRYYNGRSNYNSYSKGYYYGNRNVRSNSYYCPVAGYSQYRVENKGCYQHDDHFHCE